MKHFTFPINNWNHLYSLQQAVAHNSQLTGRTLSISGSVKNSAFLNHLDTPISIQFIQVDTAPTYPLKSMPDDTPGAPVLSTITLQEKQLSTEILVEPRVFEELRKNLMEYADIEGIHIMVTSGLYFDDECADNQHPESQIWADNQSPEILQPDYAMKGDA